MLQTDKQNGKLYLFLDAFGRFQFVCLVRFQVPGGFLFSNGVSKWEVFDQLVYLEEINVKAGFDQRNGGLRFAFFWHL